MIIPILPTDSDATVLFGQVDKRITAPCKVCGELKTPHAMLEEPIYPHGHNWTQFDTCRDCMDHIDKCYFKVIKARNRLTW